MRNGLGKENAKDRTWFKSQLVCSVFTKQLHDFDGDDVHVRNTISEVASTTVGSETTMLDGDNGSARWGV
jgi:hypothetical protein